MGAAPATVIPDFCRLLRLFAVLVVAQVVVVVVALAPSPEGFWGWPRFFAASLFAQWLALTSAVLLCTARKPLQRLPQWLALLLAWLLPIAVAAGGSALVHELDVSLGYGLSLPMAQRADFVVGCAAIAAVIGAVALRYFYVQEAWQQQVKAQAEAEVRALQARIRPHFLFNSMNTIASLVRSDPETAERAVEDLSDLFRAALGAGKGESTLGDELVLVERYLAIEALRLGPRLAVDWSLPQDLPRDLPMPRLVLQPLVENAVQHGVARLTEGGRIAISARRSGQRLHLHIGNPCPSEPGDSAGNRHAQDSTAQRLAHHFGGRARMTVARSEGYYAVDLELPLS
jgi:two-component system, LytTR family, sensor histidine kinase AlgZ